MSEQIFEGNGLIITAVTGEANGESDRARLEFDFDVSRQYIRLDKFDVRTLRLALNEWAAKHPTTTRRKTKTAADQLFRMTGRRS